MLYMGVDLGKRKSRIAILDKNGEVYAEGRIPNHRQTIERFVKRLREPVTMVCETGNKSFWLADIMEGCGAGVHVANAYKVKLIAEARIKTDKVDARILAELLRVKFIPEVYIRKQEIRVWREVFRRRSHIVRMRTQLYNRIHSILDRYGVEYHAKQLRAKGASSWIGTLELPEAIQESIGQYMKLIHQLTGQIESFQKRLKGKIKLDEKARYIVELLMSILLIFKFASKYNISIENC